MEIVHHTRRHSGQIDILNSNKSDNNDNIMGYVRYLNKLDQPWAPKIFITFIETLFGFKRKGIGKRLLKELKEAFPGEILTLEVMYYGETDEDILKDFYTKEGFTEICSTSTGYVFAYIPSGRSIKELQPVPADILYNVIMLDEDTYIFSDIIIEDFRDILLYEYKTDKVSFSVFREFYDTIINSELMDFLKYF